MTGKKRVPECESDRSRHNERPAALDLIGEALKGLQFGQLTILVQDGVVIQIERTEKRRLK